VVEIATRPVRDVFVASLILAIEVELNTSRPKIARWKARFEKNGIEGVEGRHKGSKPRTITAAVQAKVLRRATQKPDDGSTETISRDRGMGVMSITP
jgi:transposase